MRTILTILITAVLVGGGVYYFLSDKSVSDTEGLPKLTAQEAFELAATKVQEYGDDFYLTKIDSTSGHLEPNGGNEIWEVYFANDDGEAILVNVVDGEIGTIGADPVTLVDPTHFVVDSPAYYTIEARFLTPIVEGWMDSDEALELAKAECGIDAPTNFNLVHASSANSSYWSAKCGLTGQTTLTIDAISKEVKSQTFYPD